jgi:hypothetical protein
MTYTLDISIVVNDHYNFGYKFGVITALRTVAPERQPTTALVVVGIANPSMIGYAKF